MNFSTLSLILLLATTGGSLDEETAKERRCIASKTFSNISFAWVESVQRWYYPIWSRLELYRTASDILQLPVWSISSSVLAAPCVSCNAKYECIGFNHSAVPLVASMDETTGVSKFKSASQYARSGTNTIVLSDNQNYVVSLICWDDNEASYEIWTPVQTISETDKKKALDFLQKVGFNMSLMVETSYERCPPEK